jgi:hypothetical protein
VQFAVEVAQGVSTGSTDADEQERLQHTKLLRVEDQSVVVGAGRRRRAAEAASSRM